ncbi:MAG: peptidase S41 [Chitinophagaceae bacterium]|nr:peptidase S41 [Chitinophagaceae bacterium]
MNPSTKFPAEALREDYTLLRQIMEKHHPSLYWYTPKDSMDLVFDRYYQLINDSMTRQQFGFKILAPVTTKVHCGHTSFNYPPRYNKRMKEYANPSFPLFMKIWGDTMLVTSNLNKKDSLLKRGIQITSINGLTAAQLADTLFKYMPADGYAENVNYIRLSAAFPYYHRNILGLSKQYEVGYIDSLGQRQTVSVPVFDPSADSTLTAFIKTRNRQARPPRPREEEPWESIRSFSVDTAYQLAIMKVHSFAGKGRLPSFYRKSFRTLQKRHIPNLVIDLRSNGGGRVDNYTALTRYLKSTDFKVADTVFTNSNGLGSYRRYFRSGWLNSMILFLVTSKREDNKYHFRYWERHVFHPRKKNHYKGNVYVLINGPTFSASTLFAHTLKGQPNVTLVGEEAGGGWHGNSGILIPDVVLPHTKMRVRLPLFRIVQYQHVPKDGRGVMPDIYVPPTAENVRNGVDGKMQKVRELIRGREHIQ